MSALAARRVALPLFFAASLIACDSPRVSTSPDRSTPDNITAPTPGDPNGTIRPYVGAGLNYTVFFDEGTSGALAGSKLELDSSFGIAGQAGLDIAIAKDWFANIDVRWMDIDTKAKLNGTSIGTVEIDPYTFGISVGRRF